MRPARSLGFALLVAASALCCTAIRAEGPEEPAVPAVDSTAVETTVTSDSSVHDAHVGVGRVTGQPVANIVDEKQWPDPTVTLLKSMVVPGWGQITNHKYVKAAFAIGLETWFITGAIVNNSRANDALDRWRATDDPSEKILHYYDYQYYRGNRADYLWLLGITVFVSMFDAYVDAHLRPYQEDTIPGTDPPRGVRVVIDF